MRASKEPRLAGTTKSLLSRRHIPPSPRERQSPVARRTWLAGRRQRLDRRTNEHTCLVARAPSTAGRRALTRGESKDGPPRSRLLVAMTARSRFPVHPPAQRNQPTIRRKAQCRSGCLPARSGERAVTDEPSASMPSSRADAIASGWFAPVLANFEHAKRAETLRRARDNFNSAPITHPPAPPHVTTAAP